MLKINAMFLKVFFLLNGIWIIKAEHAISEQMMKIDHHGKLTHIGEHEPEHHEIYAPSFPSYKFSYKISDPHTHDFKGQTEARHGDVVKGVYWLIEPTGNKRTVTYYADDKVGFHVTIHNSKKDETLHFPSALITHHDQGIEENSEDVGSDIDIRLGPTEGEDNDGQSEIQNEESRGQAPAVERLDNLSLQQVMRGPNERNHHISAEELDESHAGIERKVDLQRLLPIFANLDIKANPYQLTAPRTGFQPLSGVGERYDECPRGNLIDKLKIPVRENIDFDNRRLVQDLQRNRQEINSDSDSENLRSRNNGRQRLPFLNEQRRLLNQNRYNVPQTLINRLIDRIQGKFQPKPYDIRPLRHRDNKPRLINPRIQNDAHDWEQNNRATPPNLQKYIRVAGRRDHSYERNMDFNKVDNNRKDPVKVNRPIVYESYSDPIIHRTPSNINGQRNILPRNRNFNYKNNYAPEQYPLPIENVEHYDNLEAYEMGLASDIMKKIQRIKPIFRQKMVAKTKSKIGNS